MTGRGSPRTALFAVALVLGAAEPALAFESEIEATADAQFYTLRSPYGEPLIRRRRYTETLLLHVYDLQGEAIPGKPRLSLKTRMRLDADFGQESSERDPASTDFIPGLEQAPLDLMYAYLEGRDYFGGYVGFKLGRQYVVDALGFWSFDGAEVSLWTPAYLMFEGYAGFEQRSGLPLLATDRFAADGVWRGDRDGLERDEYTAYLESARLAPAYGFAVETTDLGFLHSRLSYRKVINRDRVVVSPFLQDAGGGLYFVDGDRTSSERLAGSLRVDAGDFGTVTGSAVYDFYNQVFSEAMIGLDVYATARLTAGADLEYYLPTFDGDSIWNWFTHRGMTTLRARASFQATRRLDAAVTGGVRRYETEGEPDTYADTGERAPSGDEIDPFATLGSRYRWTDGSVALHALAELGGRGHRVGADVTTRKFFDNGYYDALVVLSLYDFQDDLRPTREATSFMYVLGGGISPGLEYVGRTRLGVEFDHTVNRLVGQRFRLLATLSLALYP
jgi:hypothetical protein